MKRVCVYAKSLIKHPLFSGSAVMIFGSNLANFIAYIYHLVVGRMLGPSSYGELSAVLSILGIFFASFNFLGIVIVKFVSSAKKSELNSLFSWFSGKSVKGGLILAALTLALTPFLSRFLDIKTPTLLLIVPILGLSVTSLIYRSFLQGLMRFREIVISINSDMLLRLLFGIAFVYVGFSSFGAVLGIAFSTVFAFLLTRYFLHDYHSVKNKVKFSRTNEVLRYAAPILFASIATNSMFSTDVILVKHFFSPQDAGIYASLSTLGKIIFFGAGPVGSVMFPMISKRHSQGVGYKKIFFLSLLLTLAIALGVLVIYWLIPELSIKILYGGDFLAGAPYLVWFGVFMTLFTISSLILNYFLSRNKTTATVIVVVAAFVQILGIWFYHDTLTSVIKVSILASLVFLISLLLYFGYEAKDTKPKD